MPAVVSLRDDNLWYRVRHPEFEPNYAYRAIAFIDYAESAWSKLLFINERGMTYGVKVKWCLCLNTFTGKPPNEFLGDCEADDSREVVGKLIDDVLLKLPWPKPRVENPDLKED